MRWAPAKEQATNGWNLPTRNELAAFSGMLNITISNRGTYGLHGYYWTSEGYGLSGAWVASYEGGIYENYFCFQEARMYVYVEHFRVI